MADAQLEMELYRHLYLIRHSEQKIIDYYLEDEMKTPMHMSLGAEAISVGFCSALGTRAQVYSTYRSHAAYLSLAQETDQFFAELYGKDAGMANGRAGSMHLSAPAKGYMGASAIVGSTLPLAVGSAFANKRQGTGKIATVFFGDGALDEGAFWESMNMASVMQVPALFVCEDNAIAVHAPQSVRQGYGSIAELVGQLKCHVFETDSTDVSVIREIAQEAITAIEKTGQPAFVRCQYYRYLEHVGVFEDFKQGYRDKSEFETWYQRDPLNTQRDKLLALGVTEEAVSAIETTIHQQVENSIALAKKAAFPKPDVLYRDVYA